MRYFIEVSYHGQAYHGWQIQPNAHTVQAEIQQAIEKLSGQALEVMGSGRTDRGVHAKQQFLHIDIILEDPADFAFRLNGILPNDISITSINEVNQQAHARFDAEWRSYRYYMGSKKDPFSHDRCYYFTPKLDMEAMNLACGKILGPGNFQSFSKVKTGVNNFECDIRQAEWRLNNEVWVFYVSANRFLRGMVRALVGTLIQVGTGRMSISEFEEVVSGRDRSLAGPSVPAHGLFLTEVKYPESVYKI